MGDWPQSRTLAPGDGGFVSTSTSLYGLHAGTAFVSTAWPAANLAIFVPFVLDSPKTVHKMATGAGVTSTGNFDVGIYDRFGNRMVSSGATAKGSSVEHIIDVTDTRLGPGLYYLAMSADGTNNYVMLTVTGTNPVPLQKCRALGILQMATAYVLPDPATFAAYAQTTGVIPAIAAYLRNY